jgi:hypothetical protein
VARLIAVVVLVFLVLLALRALRLLLVSVFPPSGARRRAPDARGRTAIEAEMVRDPVCGAWVDRRIALAGRRGAETVAVCSETCRARLERGA